MRDSAARLIGWSRPGASSVRACQAHVSGPYGPTPGPTVLAGVAAGRSRLDADAQHLDGLRLRPGLLPCSGCRCERVAEVCMWTSGKLSRNGVIQRRAADAICGV